MVLRKTELGDLVAFSLRSILNNFHLVVSALGAGNAGVSMTAGGQGLYSQGHYILTKGAYSEINRSVSL